MLSLGPGGSSVLALAQVTSACEVILDDRAARRYARTRNIPFRGTLSLILLAKKTGAIPAAAPALFHLREAGMYLSDHVLAMAQAEVDESLTEL